LIDKDFFLIKLQKSKLKATILNLVDLDGSMLVKITGLKQKHGMVLYCHKDQKDNMGEKLNNQKNYPFH
jgi:hypothetical protein